MRQKRVYEYNILGTGIVNNKRKGDEYERSYNVSTDNSKYPII